MSAGGWGCWCGHRGGEVLRQELCAQELKGQVAAHNLRADKVNYSGGGQEMQILHTKLQNCWWWSQVWLFATLDKKVKNSFDQNSFRQLSALSSADNWGQKNLLTVSHPLWFGFFGWLQHQVSWANCFPCILSPERAAASCGFDVRSSPWWLHCLSLCLSPARVDTDTWAVFPCGSVSLKATVTNNTLSCLILEIVLLQEVNKGSVKLCWCLVSVVDRRSQGWVTSWCWPRSHTVLWGGDVVRARSFCPHCSSHMQECLCFTPGLMWNLNTALMEGWAQTGFEMRGLVQ